MRRIRWKLFWALVIFLLVPWSFVQVFWMKELKTAFVDHFMEVKREVGQFNQSAGEQRAESEQDRSRLTMAAWSRSLRGQMKLHHSLLSTKAQYLLTVRGQNKRIKEAKKFLKEVPSIHCLGLPGGRVVGACSKKDLARIPRKNGHYPVSLFLNPESPFQVGLLKKLGKFWFWLDLEKILKDPTHHGFEEDLEYAVMDNTAQVYYFKGEKFMAFEDLLLKAGVEGNKDFFINGINRYDVVDGTESYALKSAPIWDKLWLVTVDSALSAYGVTLGDHRLARRMDTFLKIKLNRMDEEITFTGLLILLAILIGTFMAAIWLSRKVTLPINAIKERASAIAKGDLDSSLEVDTNDEIGELASSINEMVDGLKERQSMKDTFGKAVSPQVFNELIKLDEKPFMYGEQRDVTVLVGDFRGFTEASERMSPEELIGFLNSYFHRFISVIDKYGGTLDKYLGDGIMVVFGAPIPHEDHADRAIAAALEILKIVDEFNFERLADRRDLLNYGIGLNSGQVVAGRIGTRDRFDYTVIGDEVNLAFRTQDFCKQLHSRLLLTEKTKNALSPESNYPMEFVGQVKIRGKKDPTNLFSIKDVGSGRFTVPDPRYQVTSKDEDPKD